MLEFTKTKSTILKISGNSSFSVTENFQIAEVLNINVH